MAGRKPRRRPAEHVPLDVDRILLGGLRTETRMGFTWNVQPMGAANALKAYRCPGCELLVEPGTAHVVVWRADSLFGDRAVGDRRHWHAACWRIA